MTTRGLCSVIGSDWGVCTELDTFDSFADAIAYAGSMWDSGAYTRVTVEIQGREVYAA